jgi:hypothetical protein
MIKLRLYILLLLMLPLLAISFLGAPEVMGEQVNLYATPQISSFNKSGKSPCHCKATTGLGCSPSGSVGLPSGSSNFDRSDKSSFSSLTEIALSGNTEPVPLPPPKV